MSNDCTLFLKNTLFIWVYFDANLVADGKYFFKFSVFSIPTVL